MANAYNVGETIKAFPALFNWDVYVAVDNVLNSYIPDVFGERHKQISHRALAFWFEVLAFKSRLNGD